MPLQALVRYRNEFLEFPSFACSANLHYLTPLGGFWRRIFKLKRQATGFSRNKKPPQKLQGGGNVKTFCREIASCDTKRLFLRISACMFLFFSSCHSVTVDCNIWNRVNRLYLCLLFWVGSNTLWVMSKTSIVGCYAALLCLPPL